jgi:phage tail-like protein
MAQFTVNATRFDPYKNFKFRVKWDGATWRASARSARCKRTTECVKHRDGGDPSTAARSPGRPSSRRSRWSAASPTTRVRAAGRTRFWNYGAGLGAEVSLKDFRKDIIIEVYNEGGQLGARVQGVPLLGVGLPGLPDLDCECRTPIAIQHLKLENEGWERDLSVTEPS